MKTLKLHQTTPSNIKIKPLEQLPRLTYTITHDRQSRVFPSSMEILSLAVDLNYKAHLILNKEAKCKKGLCIAFYIKEAMNIHNILSDYENSYIDMRKYNLIKRAFGI